VETESPIVERQPGFVNVISFTQIGSNNIVIVNVFQQVFLLSETAAQASAERADVMQNQHFLKSIDSCDGHHGSTAPHGRHCDCQHGSENT
jgi:hypothetical protein